MKTIILILLTASFGASAFASEHPADTAKAAFTTEMSRSNSALNKLASGLSKDGLQGDENVKQIFNRGECNNREYCQYVYTISKTFYRINAADNYSATYKTIQAEVSADNDGRSQILKVWSN